MRVTFASIAAGCFCALIFASAAAQPSEAEAVDATIACRDIVDDLERLACLDSAAEALSVTRIIQEEAIVESKKKERSFFGLRKKKSDPADQEPPQTANKTEEFGGEYLPETIRKKEEGRLKKITAKIVEVSLSASGKVTVTLENGQVWRQLDSDSTRLVFSSRNRLYTARIKRGLAGSYFMRINELGRSVRARRIE